MVLHNKIIKGVIKTVIYSDIFDYPLNRSEIYKYYIGKKADKNKINKTIDYLINLEALSSSGNYVFLNGRKSITVLREKRGNISSKKWKIARKVSQTLSKIPTVKLIGVSGSLSMNNADTKDDIDLFIITSKGTLWMTRLIVNLTLLAKGIKRSRFDSFGINLICPNMFIDEDSLEMDRNLFIAHEIAQLKVLVNKNNTYEKLLTKNKWVLKYMPNAFKRDEKEVSSKKANIILSSIDWLFYSLQYLYMRRRVTSEKIGSKKALFHPKDKRKFVEILFAQRYKMYENYLIRLNSAQPQATRFLGTNDTPGY